MSTATAPILPAPDWQHGVLDALHEQIFENPELEVGGVLVGDVDPTGAVRVNGLIPAHRARPTLHRAVLDGAAWGRVHDVMARWYRGQHVLGWYVARPGAGVALSAVDLDIHRRYFSRADQFVLAVDSTARLGGLFFWQGPAIRLVAEGPIEPRPTAATSRIPWRGAGVVAVGGLLLGALVHVGVGV